MSNLFSGLEEFGLGDFKEKSLYDQNKDGKAVLNEPQPDTLLFDRSIRCPVCNNLFYTRTIKTGKAKLLSTDTDLRPRYDIIDPILYDAIICNHCGYAALNRFFNKITGKQAAWIKENISSKYKSKEYPSVYTYEIGIERYKLALLNSLVKKVKPSEKAYICLKLSWLYRGYEEELLHKHPVNQDKLKAVREEKKHFVVNAYEGFISAYEFERFPVCGLQEITVMYLIGELARRIEKYEDALKWLSRVIVSSHATERLKNRARESKDLIKKSKE